MIISPRDAREIFTTQIGTKKNFSKKFVCLKKKQFAKPAKMFLH